MLQPSPLQWRGLAKPRAFVANIPQIDYAGEHHGGYSHYGIKRDTLRVRQPGLVHGGASDAAPMGQDESGRKGQ